MSKAIQLSAGLGLNGAVNGIESGIDWKAAILDLQSKNPANLSNAITDYFKDLRASKGLPHAVHATKATRPGHISGLPSSPDLDLRAYGPYMDQGVMYFFDEKNKRQSMNPTYQFANLSAQAVIFEQKKEGQPVRLRHVSGATPTLLSSVTWQGGLGIDDDAKRFDEYGVYEENVQRAPGIYDNTIAGSFHALITSLGAGANETWSTDLITTLNNAGAQIIEDSGEIYGLGDRPTFGLYYNHRNWVDVHKALVSNLTLPNDNNSAKALQWDIVPIPTRRLPVNTFYLGLPGYDNVDVIWDDLFSEFGRDYARGEDAMIYRARRSGGIGNQNQWRKIVKP